MTSAADWTRVRNKEGRTIQVKLVDVEGQSVKAIHKRSGRKIALDFASLAESSQKIIINWAKENIASEIEKELTTGNSVERDLKASRSGSDDQLFKKYYPRSKSEIKAGLKEIKKRRAEAFASKGQHQSVTELNIFRFLCGVSYDVELDPELNDQAKAAAEACEKAGLLSHDIGSYTDKCNLAANSNTTLEKTVAQYIEDSGANNRDRRGHRRWCLQPELDKTGFGESGTYFAMHCFSHGGKSKRKAHAYPGMGLYPKEYLLSDCWSLYLTEQAPETQELKIEIFKLKTRPTKTFGWSEEIPGKKIDVKFVYTFNNVINFEPAKLINGRGIYLVRVTGGGVKEQYVTELF